MLSCASGCFNGVHCNLIAFIKLLLRHSLGPGKYLPFTQRREKVRKQYWNLYWQLLQTFVCHESWVMFNFGLSFSRSWRKAGEPPNFYWCCFFTFNHQLLQLRTHCRKETFVSNLNEWFRISSRHLTSHSTIDYITWGWKSKALFLSSFIYTSQFSYIIFPFPNVRPSILPSPTLFPAQSKPKLLTSHRLWRRVSARMAISRR